MRKNSVLGMCVQIRVFLCMRLRVWAVFAKLYELARLYAFALHRKYVGPVLLRLR